jgi:hypothetical protein
MDASHVQTPPPTRGSSTKRKQYHTQSFNVGTPTSLITGSASSLAATNGQYFDQTPVPFPNLQFSPGLQFPSNEPLSAPVYPQGRILWDQFQSGSNSDVDMTNVPEDPFGPTPNRPVSTFDWDSMLSAQMQTSTESLLADDTVDPSHSGYGATTSAQTSSNLNANHTTSDKYPSVSTSVDPSLLFTFGGSSTPLAGLSNQPSTLQNIDTRQPYEQQTRESQREREQARKARQNHSRTSTSTSMQSAGNIRPGLQRSKTDASQHKSRFAVENSGNSITAIPRRSSPLKRLSGQSLSSIPEQNKARSRTRLIIDERGFAQTLTETNSATTTTSEEKSGSGLRAQYPGLWSDDSDESEEDVPVSSRPGSFIFQPPVRRTSKHARVDSLGRSNSVKKPRPASMISLEGLSFADPTSKDDQVDSYRRFSSSSLNDTAGLSDGSPQSRAKGQGGAQEVLKKMYEERASKDQG